MKGDPAKGGAAWSVIGGVWQALRGKRGLHGDPPKMEDLGTWVAEGGEIPAEGDLRLTKTAQAAGNAGDWAWNAENGGPLYAKPINRAGSILTLGQIDGIWHKLEPMTRPKHPLAPLLEAWAVRPKAISPESHLRRRLLPRIEPPSVEMVERVSTPLQAGGGPALPLFDGYKAKVRVPVLDLVDRTGAPVMARGRGLPLPTRILLWALMQIPPGDRLPGREQSYAVQLRQLARDMFPGSGWTTLVRGKLEKAISAIDAFWIVLPDGETLWRPVIVRAVKRSWRPDSEIRFSVDCPPGIKASGAPVEMADLWPLAATSAPASRALIAALTLNFQPGVTRVPIPRAGIHAWTRDETRYPALDLGDRKWLAFGAGDRKNRTRAEIDAPWQRLPGLRWVDAENGAARLIPVTAGPGPTASTKRR